MNRRIQIGAVRKTHHRVITLLLLRWEQAVEQGYGGQANWPGSAVSGFGEHLTKLMAPDGNWLSGLQVP